MRSHVKAPSAGPTERQATGPGRLLLAAAVTLLVAGLFAGSAHAAPTTIAEFGSGAGEVDFPRGTAVEQSSGDLYVADRNNFRISKFDADGSFLMSWGSGVADGVTPELQTCGPEATPPTSSCFKGFFGTGAGSVAPGGVAVDQSSGAVYVSEGNPRWRVSKFTSSGQFVFMVGRNVNKTKVAEGGATQAEKNICTAASGDTCGAGEAGTGPNEFSAVVGESTLPLTGIAVDSAGVVWVGSVDRLSSFDASGVAGAEAALPGTGLITSLAVDASGDFYIVRPGTNETQEVNLPGFANGDSFRLGNLPAGCSASQTGPIAYDGSVGTPAVQEALEEQCGDAIVAGGFAFGNGNLFFVNELAAQDVAQLTCTALSGGGSCSVTTTTTGAPGTVEKLDPSGALLETLHTGAPEALTLDAAGNLYIGDRRGKYHFRVLNAAGETTSVFGAGQVKTSIPFGFGPEGNALALHEGSGRLYAANTLTGEESAVQAFPLPEPGPLPENQHVEDLEPTTVTLAADLNPEGAQTSYHFEWGTTDSYGEVTPTETLPGEGFDAEAVEAELAGLSPETTYHFRLCASNADGTNCGADTTFTTLPVIRIEAQWATDITSTSAVLHAEIDPLGVPGEWWIEYGTSEGYGQSTAEGALPAAFGAVAVSTPFVNLTPGTTYHYRFAVRQERDGTVYTVHGADKTFTTQVSALGFELPDNRAWEMVSPPNKHGARLLGPEWPTPVIQAAADGNGLAYASRGSIELNPDGSRVLEAAAILARRGENGWRSKDLALPNQKMRPLGAEWGEYKLFTPDLSRALVEPRDGTELSPQTSERAPHLRENTEPPIYTPLVTGKEGFANVPPGTVFGGDEESSRAAVEVAGANEDLSHIVLRSSQVPLVEGAPGGTPSVLYLWREGQLAPLSVLPGEGGAIVGQSLIGSDRITVHNAVSADGSRVFWSPVTGGEATDDGLIALYMRDTLAEETVRLDVAEPGASGAGLNRPTFQGASADGTVVFFKDTRQLTDDASPSGRDLYRCEIPPGPAPAGCAALTNLTGPAAGPGESAEVQGLAAGVSEDGTRIYFVAEGVLDTAPNQFGDSAEAGAFNLYRWQQGAGVRFIATLAPADDAVWGWGGSWSTGFRDVQNAAHSPNGRYLSFMSESSLTGYHNLEAASGEPVQEVFRYDAVQDELACVSCNPSGAAPEGQAAASRERLLVDPRALWPGSWLAASLPQMQPSAGVYTVLHRARAVLDNGRIFFHAFDSLVPADSNGEWDVYQWEPTGLGDCTASSGGAAIARSAGGCVSLLSSGTAEEEAGFLDASPSGDDVFFLTTAKLSVTDEDEERDVYDVRVNGVPARLQPSAECLGEACQPAAKAPEDPTPASATFKGTGSTASAQGRGCGTIARRTAKLSRRAKALRRKAERANDPGTAKQLRREANGLSKQVKRCRGANRRAGR